MGVTGGIIDSTVYVDNNEFANDQDSQFMNEAFVNSANAAFPSYDLGGAAEFASGQWSVNGDHGRNGASSASVTWISITAAKLPWRCNTRAGPTTTHR